MKLQVKLTPLCLNSVFFDLAHDRWRIMHSNVTEHPTSTRVVQQLREVFPHDGVRHSNHLSDSKSGKYTELARWVYLPSEASIRC